MVIMASCTVPLMNINKLICFMTDQHCMNMFSLLVEALALAVVLLELLIEMGIFCNLNVKKSYYIFFLTYLWLHLGFFCYILVVWE